MISKGAVIVKGSMYAQIENRIVWGKISDATLFSSSYKAGLAIQALRDQGFNVKSMSIADVTVKTIIELVV